MSTEYKDDLVLRLENASVHYYVPSERIGTFKEYVIRKLQRKIRHREIWALNDVSMEVSRAEVIGVIGRNGAGKSTMLKLIARVLRPSSGRVWVKGHVAPLLAIGAGFHPELTGRENVFLNGALLGFSRKEMEQKFNRIIDYAELWDFIDSPLRLYSSGMIARLGFAVAMAERPDVLLVDEVLAVGDEQFRKKCSSSFQEFRESGTTIILVSHSMATVERICTRAIWLNNGRIESSGSPKKVINEYRSYLNISKL